MISSQNVGARDTKILLQIASVSYDSLTNQQSLTWANYGSVWGELLKPLRASTKDQESKGDEIFEADQQVAKTILQVRIKYMVGILPTMRFILNGTDIYYLTAVDTEGRKSYLILTAEFRDNETYTPVDDSLTVSSVASSISVTTEQATVFSDLVERLPEAASVTLSDSSLRSLAVNWVQGTYDKDIAGAYTLSGTLTLPSGVTNPSNLTASISVTVYWSPLADASKNILWLNIANRYTMFKESQSSVPVTAVGSITDPVGFIQERSAGGRSVIASSDGRRCTYFLDTDGLPMIKFDGTSSNLIVSNSQKYLAPFTNASPSWHFKTKVKKVANGGTQVIFSSDTGSGSKAGIYMDIDNANKVNIILTKSTGTLKFYTSTFTITVADGRVDLILEITGTTGRLIVIKGGTQTTENITSIGVGQVEDAFTNLSIGALDTSAGSPYNGYMGDTVFGTGALSAQDITNWKNYLPQDGIFRYAPIVQIAYDFTDSSKLWANSGRTTPITNNTEIIYVDNNITSLFGSLNMDATGSAGVTPVWKTAQQNAYAAAFFDGVDNELALGASTEKGGRCTYVLIYKNTDDVVGSNIMDCFQAIAEDNTNAAYLYGAEFDVTNASTGAIYAGSSQINRGNATNIHVVEREGSTLRITNGQKDTYTITNFTDGFVNTKIGHGLGSTTFMDGIILEVKKYAGVFNTTDRNALIDSFNTKYGITPASPIATGSGDVPFIINMGQSNCGDQDSTGHEAYSTIPATLSVNMPYVRRFNGSGFTASFTPMSTKNWGYMNQLMLAESARLLKPIFYMKYGKPSSGLGPDGSPIFDQTIAVTELTKAWNILNGLYPGRVKPVFVWDLGVSDASQQNNSNQYPTILPSWFATARNVIGVTSPILYLRLYSWSTQTYTSQIRLSQQDIQSSINLMVDTDNVEHTDTQHYNATGCVTLGNILETYMSALIS